MSEFNQFKQTFNIFLKKLVEELHLVLATGGSDINIINNDPNAGAAKSQPII
jgi:hypothetical protein